MLIENVSQPLELCVHQPCNHLESKTCEMLMEYATSHNVVYNDTVTVAHSACAIATYNYTKTFNLDE